MKQPHVLLVLTAWASPLSAQSLAAPITLRDSAGVTLISAGINALPRLPWRTGAPMRIPGDAEPLYQVAGVTQIRGPSALVADHGALRIRRFTSEGREQPGWGRSGEGPGEFRSITSIGQGTSDSVWVHDMVLARLNLFDRAGRPSGTVPMPPAGGAFGEVIGLRGPQVVGVSLPAIRAGMAEGLRRDSLEIYPVDRQGQRGRRVAVVPGRDQMVRIQTGDGRISVSKSTLPFGFGPLYAMAGARVVVGGTDRYDLRLHALDGRVTSVIRIAVPRVPVLGPMLTGWARTEAAAAGEPARASAVERAARRLPLHEFAPELDAVASDLAGGFWVRRFAAPEAAEAEWVVHGSSGAPVGRIMLPATWQLDEVGADYLLVVEYDADGVGEVLVVPLARR